MHKDLIIKFDDYDTDKSRNYALNNPVYAKDITASYGYAYNFDNFYINPLKSNSYDYMVVSMKVKLSNYHGKNLLQNTATPWTANGVTFTNNADGSVTVNGTASGNVAYIVKYGSKDLSDKILNKQIILSGCPNGGANNTYQLQIWNATGHSRVDIIDYGQSAIGTFTNTTTNYNIAILITSGYTCNNLVFKPMMRLASIADGTYEQYQAFPNPNLRFTIGKQTAQLPNAFTPNITTVDEWVTVSCINSLSSMIGIDRLYIMDSIFNEGTTTAHVEVKDIKVEYTNDVNGIYTTYTSYGISAEEDYSDITNDNLLEESFSLNESLCSQDDLQFGACEASYIEFECCNKNGKYKKKNISVFTNIAQENVCHGLNLSIFNPKYQGHEEIPGDHNGIRCGSEDIKKIPISLINQYKYIIVSNYIKCTELTSQNPLTVEFGFRTIDNVWYMDTERQYSFTANSEWVRYIGVIEVSRLTNKYLMDMILSFNDYYHHVTIDYKQAMLELSNTGIPSEYAESYIFNGGDYKYLLQGKYQVPLGKYHITSVQKTSNKGTKRIQAYDNSSLLDANAEDWYSSYMWGVSFQSHTSNGLQFARQIYSSYYNIASYFNIEDSSKDLTSLIAAYDYETVKANYLSNEYLNWDSTDPVHKLRYCKIPVSNPDVNKLYKVTTVNPNGYTDEDTYSILPSDYAIKVDSYYRGVVRSACILIEEVGTGQYVNRFAVDRGDYFALSPDTTGFYVYIPIYTAYNDGTGLLRLIDSVSIYMIQKSIDLKNASTRLMYYNYGTKDIFNAPGGITARQVVQSLLEVCGCFFMINRRGIPSFIYCVKSSLYPSETLYPDTDLYPRGTGETADKSLYKEYEFEDYEVKDIGRIQIKKLASDNVTPICEWEYVGDANKENTYIISDNVFYCSTEMEYDYDNMPEVSTLLTNMFAMISNIGFIPHDTKAVGLPYVEVGDRIRLEETDGSIETFIFSRYLKGIQSLEDNYEATGREKTQAISNYGYSIWEG